MTPQQAPRPPPEPDWEREVRTLGFMILQIAARYEQVHAHPRRRRIRGAWKCPLGGDSELLEWAVRHAQQHVDGPLRERLKAASPHVEPASDAK